MGASKLENLFKDKSSDDQRQGVQEKARLQQLIQKLQEDLKDPEKAKKAARIIEQFLHNK
tara:strand:+ start:2333 stop:2512 length:180 start_codon:yes stop_codon:yes gene_type:complete